MAKVGYSAEVALGLSFEGETDNLPSATDVKEALKLRLQDWAAGQPDLNITIVKIDVM